MSTETTEPTTQTNANPQQQQPVVETQTPDIQVPENLPEGVTPEAYKQLFSSFQAQQPPKEPTAPAIADAKKVLDGLRGNSTGTPSTPNGERMGVFANPMVAHLNKMYAENKPPEAITEFLTLQSMDVANMDPVKALVKQLQMEMPGLSETDARGYIETEYGASLPPESDPTYAFKKKAMESKLKVDGIKAREWLKSQKLGYDTPEAKQARQEANQNYTRKVESWKQVASTLVKPELVELSWEYEGKEIGGKFTNSFKPKLDKEQSDKITQTLVEYAVKANLDLTEDSLGDLLTLRDTVVFNMHKDEYLKHMLADFYSGMMKSLVGSQPQLFNTNQKGANTPPKNTRNKPNIKKGFM